MNFLISNAQRGITTFEESKKENKGEGSERKKRKLIIREKVKNRGYWIFIEC